MPKGGYFVLDFKNADLQVTTKIPGIYKAAIANSGKPMLITNYRIAELNTRPFFPIYSVVGEEVKIQGRLTDDGYLYTITISPDDTVKGTDVNISLARMSVQKIDDTTEGKI